MNIEQEHHHDKRDTYMYMYDGEFSTRVLFHQRYQRMTSHIPLTALMYVELYDC